MWKIVQRGVGWTLKSCGIPWKSTSIVCCDGETQRSPTGQTQSSCSSTCGNLQQRLHHNGRAFNDGDDGQTSDGADAECKWRQRMRSFRHDMWSRNNPCHFLEAVGWGTAIITGIQMTELYHRGGRGQHSVMVLDDSRCWVRYIIGPTAAVESSSTKRCNFSFNDWVVSYIDRAIGFVASALGGDCSAVQTVRFMLPAANQRTTEAAGAQVDDYATHSHTGAAEASPEVKRRREVKRWKEVEEEVSEFVWQTAFTTSTNSEMPPESSSCPAPSAPSSQWSGTAADSALSTWHQMTLNYLTSVQQNGAALHHAQSGNYSAATRIWLQASRSMAYDKSLYNLAICYQHGLGVSQDIGKAVELYTKAADLGHARSAFNAAVLLLGAPTGEVATDDDQTRRALEMLERAANMGLKEAQRELAVLYTEEPRRDMAKAACLFEKASVQKDTAATYFLGICFEHGWGVEQSEAKAAKLYAAAANAGHADALHNLAVFYEKGLGGLPVDAAEALRLHQAAIDASNIPVSEGFQAERLTPDSKLPEPGNVSTSDDSTILRRQNDRCQPATSRFFLSFALDDDSTMKKSSAVDRLSSMEASLSFDHGSRSTSVLQPPSMLLPPQPYTGEREHSDDVLMSAGNVSRGSLVERAAAVVASWRDELLEAATGEGSELYGYGTAANIQDFNQLQLCH